MGRRGLVSLLFAFLMVGGWAGVAVAATTPAPTPPPLCFVMKNGALPTCEQNSDGSWTAIYPNGSVSTVDKTTSGGTSSTKRDIEILVVVVAVIGIAGIAWWQWGPLKGRGLGRS